MLIKAWLAVAGVLGVAVVAARVGPAWKAILAIAWPVLPLVALVSKIRHSTRRKTE